MLDKSFYLNHYYFVSLLSFLLIFLPLNRVLSLDVRSGFVPAALAVPAWTLYAVRLQLVVYLFAQKRRTVFTVRDAETEQAWTVYPSHYLTPQQERQMAFQPDMILQFAHFLRDDFAARGHEVAVYADVWVSLNGRSSQPFVKPVDLAAQDYALAPRLWLEPEQDRAALVK